MVPKIKVLVVEDSAFMRKVISDMIAKEADLELVGVARNGEDALVKLQQLKPDVITMDVEMPKMNGLEALERIMEIRPTPVIMLSSLTEKDADITISCLNKGAVDFVQKPGGSISLNLHQVRDEIIGKIKLASKVNVHQHLKPVAIGAKVPTKTISISSPKFIANSQKFILIGTSTGGPKALHKVISDLPPDLNASVLVVQHMPPGFTKSLAERLNNNSPLTVKEGEDKEEIKINHVYIAPGNYHMGFMIDNTGKYRVQLTQGPLVKGHRPSVDYLFNSAYEAGVKNVLPVIMTGMGHDGRDGLIQLNKNGIFAIAESEQTCVVYGMPKSAVETGFVSKIVPLENIASEIVASLK